MRDVNKAAASIGHWVFCDVDVALDIRDIRRALDIDIAMGAPVPTEREIEVLVTGEATEPEVLRLNKVYPALDAYLTEQLT